MSWELGEMSSSIKLLFHAIPGKHITLKNVKWQQTEQNILRKCLLHWQNKANLRDLIAGTGLVILLKLDSNHRFFSHVTLKFDWWPRKIIGHLFYITSSFVHHLKPLGEFG